MAILDDGNFAILVTYHLVFFFIIATDLFIGCKQIHNDYWFPYPFLYSHTFIGTFIFFWTSHILRIRIFSYIFFYSILFYKLFQLFRGCIFSNPIFEVSINCLKMANLVGCFPTGLKYILVVYHFSYLESMINIFGNTLT